MQKESSWCSEHPVLVEDMAEVVSDRVIPWEKLNGATVLVTGATGLIGSLLVKVLLYAAESRGMNMRICAVVRSMVKAEKVFAGQKHF